MQRPDEGIVSYGNQATTRRTDVKTYRRHVSWLPQHVECVPGLTAREQVSYVGWLKGMRRSEAWEAPRRCCRRELSRGQRHLLAAAGKREGAPHRR
ncbi:P-loop NTPase family protein [Streptomyces halobius]|nr:hypothetical protein [Streptomyces halobius]